MSTKTTPTSYEALKEAVSRGEIDGAQIWEEYAKLHDATTAIVGALRANADTLESTAAILETPGELDITSYVAALRSRAQEARAAAARVA